LSVEKPSGSAVSDHALKQALDKIKLMRQEFEELLFLKQVADALRDFRRRLLLERWD